MIIIHPSDERNNPTRFIDPSSDEFSDLLYESTITRLEKLKKFSQEELSSFNQFQIIPDQSFLDKIKGGDKKYSRIYTTHIQNQKYEIRGYTFPFTLFASSHIQNFIFECGLGELTENGLGMLDLTNEIYKERVVPLN